jgi:hypothetical protein
LHLAFVAYLQACKHLAARRHGRKLQASRDLADQAEASRFTELRGFLNTELAMQTRLNADLRSAIEQAGNTLSAYIGELEDRLGKSGIGAH